MVKSAIILEMQGKFPIWHRSDGFAKDVDTAVWIFKLCGWNRGGEFPSLCVMVEEIDWEEGDRYFPNQHLCQWVLGLPVLMN